jgi:hypothetical protein
MLIKLLIIILIVLAIGFLLKSDNVERFRFNLDPLYIPVNPIPFNDVQVRRFARTVGIKRHLKINKNGRIESITYSPPKPELGETKCYIKECQPQYQLDVCWHCE